MNYEYVNYLILEELCVCKLSKKNIDFLNNFYNKKYILFLFYMNKNLKL